MKDSGAVATTLPTDHEVVMTRELDASREMIFDALIRPDLLKRWLTAPGRRMSTCEIDPRVGGSYRFAWSAPGQSDVAMHGVFREVVRPMRLVRTEVWETGERSEILVAADLIEHAGRTIVTLTVRFQSRQERDAAVASGMENGAQASFAKLAELLSSMPAAQREGSGPTR